jgi:hypothetical protein
LITLNKKDIEAGGIKLASDNPKTIQKQSKILLGGGSGRV